MRAWHLVPGLLFVIGCGVTDPTDEVGNGDGKEDSGDSSAAVKREKAVTAKFEAVRTNPTELNKLVALLPKGADLHMHLSGATVTESLIRLGAANHDCVNSVFLLSVGPICVPGKFPVPTSSSGSFWKQILGAWSMEGFTTADVTTRHDHFFSTFNKFGYLTKYKTADLLTDVRRTAAAEHVQYVEVMIALGSSTGGALGEQYIPAGGSWGTTQFKAARTAILADPKVASMIARTRTDLDTWEHQEATTLGCGTSHPEPACDVTVRFLVQATRIDTRENVFGQFIYGFALAGADKRVVGVNLVQAEDDSKALKNYHDLMTAITWIIDDATTRGAPVPVSLHAGELTPAFAKPADLASHVREAVDAGASRIGHGTDILGETDSTDLMRTMAENHIGVEICLTSNQQLLDVQGTAHPVRTLIGKGVPVMFATDDQGILRVNMNDEIARAFKVQGLGYHEIKRAIRASLSQSFLPGTRLSELTACHASMLAESLSSTCSQALAASERATAEWKLESALDAFEKALVN